MAVSKRGRFYHYEFELAGRRYRGSTKRTNRQAALKVEATWVVHIVDALSNISVLSGSTTVADFVTTFRLLFTT